MVRRKAVFLTAFCLAGLNARHAEAAPDIGGFVMTRSIDAQESETKLNPQGAFPLGYDAAEFAGLVEGQWNGLNFRLRGQAFTDDKAGDNRVLIQELDYTSRLADRWSLSVGKQTRSWGTGLSYQPLGFFRSQPDLRDPFDAEGRVTGLPMLALSYLGRNTNLDIIVSDDLSGSHDPAALNHRQWAIRVSGEPIDNLHGAFVIRQRDGSRPGFGGSLSYAVNAFDLHADVFYGPPDARLVYRGLLGEAPAFYASDPFVPQRNANYTTQSVLGVTWSPSREFAIYAEWLHKGDGLSDSQWSRFNDFIDLHAAAPISAAKFRNLAWDTQQLGFGQARRDYAYGMINWQDTDWSASLGSLVSLEGASAFLTGAFGYSFSRRLSLSLSYSQASGATDSEFGLSPYKSFLSLRLKRTFN
jgi:hypothetical protein